MLPTTATAPILIEIPLQMFVLEIVAAAGKELTVIVTELDLTHPEAVMVSVKV